MKRIRAILLAAVAGLIIGLGGVYALKPLAPTWPLAEGLTIAGKAIPATADPHAWLAEHREQALDRKVVILFMDQVDEEASLEELGVTLDVAAMAQRAQAVSHAGSLVTCWREAAAARRGEHDIPNIWRFDETVARKYLERVIKHYGESRWGKKAKKELSKLSEG